jgi:hypothetical protein
VTAATARGMADIEAAAKPIVGPMFIGQPMDLDAAAQRIVANWVALKGLVAAQASKLDESIPASHYSRVHTSEEHQRTRCDVGSVTGGTSIGAPGSPKG